MSIAERNRIAALEKLVAELLERIQALEAKREILKVKREAANG